MGGGGRLRAYYLQGGWRAVAEDEWYASGSWREGPPTVGMHPGPRTKQESC